MRTLVCLFFLTTTLLISPSLIAQDFWTLPLKDAEPHGLTSDADTLWIADYQNDFIYRFDQSAALPLGLPFSPGNPRGLAVNEEVVGGVPTQILYVAKADEIYRVNASTGAILSQFSSPDAASTNFQGLAIGQDQLWVASRGTVDRIYRYDLNSQVWSGFFDSPGTNPRGLCFEDNFLWNVDSTDDLLYKLSPADGSILGSYQIPLTSYPRGLTFYQGRFHLSERNLQIVLPFQTTEQYTNVYLAEKRFAIDDSNLEIPFLSSQPLSAHNSQIKRILIYQHGIGDDAARYFARGIHAAIQAESLDETLVLSLQILDNADFSSTPPENLIYWMSGRAWGALSASSAATYPRNERVSSFAVLDQFLSTLTSAPSQLPQLQEIVIAGHSAGGQFVNRFAASSQFDGTNAGDNRNIRLKYIVMNPSSYVYFSDKRVDPNSVSASFDNLQFAVPQNPPSDFNDYGYGLDSLFTYLSSAGSATIQSQYPQRSVVYLVGGNDTESDDLDVSPEAMLQGQNRLERSIVYYAHLRDHFGEQNLPFHQFDIIPNVGHNGRDMIASDIGLGHVFGCSPGSLGDVNGDGVVNFLDISPFVAALSAGEFRCEADMNFDGVVNFLDIAPFIAILSGQ